MTSLYRKKNVAIFISGRGSNMMALIKDMKNERYHPGHPKLVVSNNVNAEGLVFAKQNSIDIFALNVEKNEDNSVFEEKTLHILKKKRIDLICLAGFMKILSEKFIKSFSKPILNIHPSLLPSFRGLNTYQRALNAGCLIHGATVHQITKKIDNGRILGQVIIKIAENTTAKKMEVDLLPKEHLLYKKVLREFLKGNGRKILLIDPEIEPQN
ncbi:phosphoribosylglycinamide formyltransferase [Paracoccaceae bacterium]|nr:phosphoribosylglycinamide formyltransferase [Paracoccaceae bacterium]